jgi:hypothetical protein
MKTRISWYDKEVSGNNGNIDIVSQIRLNISQSADHGGPHQNAPKGRWGTNMTTRLTNVHGLSSPDSDVAFAIKRWREARTGDRRTDPDGIDVVVVGRSRIPGCGLEVRPVAGGESYWLAC